MPIRGLIASRRKIEDARLGARLSWSALAAKADISQSTITQARNGIPVDKVSIKAMADAMGVSYYSLLADDQDLEAEFDSSEHASAGLEALRRQAVEQCLLPMRAELFEKLGEEAYNRLVQIVARFVKVQSPGTQL